MSWNETSQVYQLDFGVTVSQESAKNFEIEFQSHQVCPYLIAHGNLGFHLQSNLFNVVIWCLFCILIIHCLLVSRTMLQKSSKRFLLKLKTDYIVLQYNAFHWFKTHYDVKTPPLLYSFWKKNMTVIFLKENVFIFMHTYCI